MIGRWLEPLPGRLRGAGDALFAIAVLAVVVLLVAPVPPALVDAGLALSLALAAGVLVTTLLAPGALAFASFPPLLLLTTVLRLALSVASTRLILGRGEAGRVVEAFGAVAVQGSPVAGAVIFAVLTLVQLLVVARGAERVAEVAARFSLDALPGKQMAIDADLRAGQLDAAEAGRRRRALERESALHGAMDGALKFVKGDAVAGVAIALVNATGGVVAGMARGASPGPAARRAVALAVGDGLASQLPGLLVAVAAGLAVTRVAAEEDGRRLAGEVARELLGDARAAAAVAALLGALALAPGLPAAPFAALASAAAALAWRAGRRATPPESEPRPDGGGGASPPVAPHADGTLVLEVAPDLAAVAADLRRALPPITEGLRAELGIPAPPIGLCPHARLAPGQWALLLDGVPVAAGVARLDEVEALAPVADLALARLPHRLEAAPWGPPLALLDGALAGRAAALGPVRGPAERVAAACAEGLGLAAARLLGVQEVQLLLDELEPQAPALVREVARQLPPATLAAVLRRLAEEGVPLRPLRVLLEALLEAGAGSVPALAAAARRALAHQIGHRAAAGAPLAALLLDPAVERCVRESLLGEVAALEPERVAALQDALARAVEEAGAAPVLLASGDVRRAVRGLLAPRFPRLLVLAYDELPPELQVRPLGRLALAA